MSCLWTSYSPKLAPAARVRQETTLPNGHKTPKEEMRELIDAVKPKALRERLLKVWAKL
jgi:hypothetical protein